METGRAGLCPRIRRGRPGAEAARDEDGRRSVARSGHPVAVDKLASPMSEKSDARAVPVDVSMRRPTLFGVPAMPILAAPLVVRRARVEEAGALAALLGRGFGAERWGGAGGGGGGCC